MQKFKASFEGVVAQLIPATDARIDRIPAAGEGPHVCGVCRSRLVQPTWWTQASEGSWQVALRCPDCEWSRIGSFERRQVEQLDRELERGDAELAADLAWLTHVNMVDEMDRFVRALGADAIQPFDF